MKWSAWPSASACWERDQTSEAVLQERNEKKHGYVYFIVGTPISDGDRVMDFRRARLYSWQKLLHHPSLPPLPPRCRRSTAPIIFSSPAWCSVEGPPSQSLSPTPAVLGFSAKTRHLPPG